MARGVRIVSRLRNPVRSIYKGPLRKPFRSPVSFYPIPHFQKPFVSPRRKRSGFRRPL